MRTVCERELWRKVLSVVSGLMGYGSELGAMGPFYDTNCLFQRHIACADLMQASVRPS